MTARLNWAISKVSWTDKWELLCSSVKKKWNLDRADGCQHYWHDFRKEPRFFKSRQFGGGFLMTRAAFNAYKKLTIVFVDGRIDSVKYVEMLKQNLTPFLCINDVFQQDNAQFMYPVIPKSIFLIKKLLF